MKFLLFRLRNYLNKDRINLIKSIFINFTFLPFNEAVYLPILVFGKCKIESIEGSIAIMESCNIKYGMIKIGLSDHSRSFYSGTYLNIRGKLILDNNVTIRRGAHINIDKNGTLKLFKNVYIGDNCSITSKYYIEMNENTRIGNNVYFIDTDFHFLYNLKSNSVKKNYGAIIIGKGNWIGPFSFIKKNTKTPNYTIVVGPFSLLTKDYTSEILENTCIAGVPAKQISSNQRRINNTDTELMLEEFFAKNTDLLDSFENINVDVDLFCTPTD